MHYLEANIMTPADVFAQMVEDGYKVDYGRVAIVSALNTLGYVSVLQRGRRPTSRHPYPMPWHSSLTASIKVLTRVKQVTSSSTVKWAEDAQHLA
jgi:hypothetical protein